jgi:hypothetical protein
MQCIAPLNRDMIPVKWYTSPSNVPGPHESPAQSFRTSFCISSPKFPPLVVSTHTQAARVFESLPVL